MNLVRHSRRQRNSLSSMGWRRGPGRGGTLCEAAPLLGPLPTPASRGEEELHQVSRILSGKIREIRVEFFCLPAFISVYQRLIYRLNDFVKSSFLISTTFFSNFD